MYNLLFDLVYLDKNRSRNTNFMDERKWMIVLNMERFE